MTHYDDDDTGQVGAFGKPEHCLDGVSVFQVEHDALLAGIELPEAGARAVAERHPRAHHVAFRRIGGGWHAGRICGSRWAVFLHRT
jgi:hypothetical protein